MEMEARVTKLEEKVTAMGADLKIFSNSVDQFDRVITKLDATLTNLDRLFIELRANQIVHDREIVELKSGIKKNDEEHKVNLAQLVKDNIIQIVVFIALVAQIIATTTK